MGQTVAAESGGTAQRRCGYREMPEQPCEAAVSWVITTGDGHSHQFTCDRHKNAVLAKVSPAHRVRTLGEWLAERQRGPAGEGRA